MTRYRSDDTRDPYVRALAIFKQNGGILRTMQAIRGGVHSATLYAMRDAGLLDMVSRGVYRIADIPPLGNPDLVTIATRVPDGVICLISALSFHALTTQIPHEVHVALVRGAEQPRVDHPPTRFFRFSHDAYTQGVETHQLDGVGVHIFCVEKTLADCFKFRNAIGLDTVIEALRFYFERRATHVDLLMHYAEVCRVHNVMRPYLEALV